MKSQELNLQVEAREKSGTSVARRLRRNGKVPAVVYGHGGVARPLTLEDSDVHEVLHHAGIININVEDDKLSAILKDVQRDVMRGHVTHVDFQEVRADEVVGATVPLEPVGVPAGESSGGNLEQLLHEIDIRCLPANLPESITVDVSELGIDDALLVKDLELPEGIEADSDPDQLVVHVVLPREIPEEEEELAAEEEGAEEPEVISQGKAEPEEEQG